MSRYLITVGGSSFRSGLGFGPDAIFRARRLAFGSSNQICGVSGSETKYTKVWLLEQGTSNVMYLEPLGWVQRIGGNVVPGRSGPGLLILRSNGLCFKIHLGARTRHGQ